MKRVKRPPFIPIAFLMVVSSLVLSLPEIPNAHASGPTVSGTIASANPLATPTTCVTGLVAANSGDTLALTVSGEYSAAGQNYSGVPTDPVGTTSGWHRIKFVTITGSSTLNGGTYTAWAGAWVTTSTSTGNHETAVGYNNGGSNNHWVSWCGLTVMTGLSSTNFTVQSYTCYNTCSGTMSTAAINYNSGNIVLATGAADSADNVDNFQLKATSSPSFIALSAMCLTSSQNICHEYFVPNGPGSTTFPMTTTLGATSNIQAEVSFEFGMAPVPTTITVTKVVGCNFYQEQCWWEPTIFYGMYVGLWVVIAASINVRARSLTFILGAATSYASLYLILLGELPYPFAIISFAAALVYALRLDGVF